MSDLILLEEAEDFSEELLYELFRQDLEKAADPTKPRGFLLAVSSLFRSIRRKITGDEKEAEDRASGDLDRNWKDDTPAARRSAINRAASRIGRLGVTLPPKLRSVWRRHADRIVRTTRRAVTSTFGLGIKTGPTAFDDDLVGWITDSQTNFVTNEYGRRAIALSRRARRLVSDGIRRGLFRDEMSRALSRDVKLTVTGRSRWYYDVSSRIFINRGRTLSALSSYQDADFTTYRFVAVRDARTSNVCRLMHNKTFTVSSGLKQFEDFSELRNPEGVRDLAPFVTDGFDGEGNPALIFNRNGQSRVMARVVSSGVGQRGERGRFSGALDKEQMVRAGIIAPPLH